MTPRSPRPARQAKARAGFAALLLCLGAALPLAGQAALPLAPQADGIRKVAVFRYLDREGSLQPQHQFARFTVPDMVRLTLIEQASLELLEKNQVDQALAAYQGPDAGLEAELQAMALALGADHYIWGYVLSSGQRLSVVHHIVDSQSGRTIHMKADSLEINDAIFDTLAASARDFATWVKTSLPPRLPEVQLVETTVTVEKPVAVPLPPAERGVLALGGNLIFFVGELAPYLDFTGGASLAYRFGRGPLDPIRLGLRVDTSVLRQKALLWSNSTIQILMPSASLSAAWPLELGAGFRLTPALDLGAAVVFGRVNDKLVSYARPQAALNLDLSLDIVPELQLALGARANAVFAAWELQTMIALSPCLQLCFRP